MMYSPRIVDAFRFAYEVHGEQVRKGSPTPYITHVMAVAGIVGEHGGDEDTFIAALLHDAVEDGDGYETLQAIRATFGERVAGYVEMCSDAFVQPKPDWRERKVKFIDSVRSAVPEVRLIMAADKFHNLCATIGDYQVHGEALWERFNGGRSGTLWYYGAVTEALGDGWEHPLMADLRAAVDDLHAACAPHAS